MTRIKGVFYKRRHRAATLPLGLLIFPSLPAVAGEIHPNFWPPHQPLQPQPDTPWLYWTAGVLLLLLALAALAFFLRRIFSRRFQTEDELTTIFNMATDLICIADITTATFTRVNPAFEKTLGYTQEELLGQPFLNFVHPDDVESTVAIIQEKLQQGDPVISFENRYRCKDGSYRCLDWNSNPVPEKGLTYAIAHDVTERKKTEQALQQSEQNFRQLVESIEEVFWIRDLKTEQIVYISPSYEKIWGQTVQSAYENPGSFMNSVHPDDKEWVEQAYRKSLADPTALEYRIVLPDRTPRWISIQTFQPATEPGEPERQVGVAQDITQRKLAEEQIRIALEEKEVLLRELYHRTKNNMQVISSILALQAAQIQDGHVQDVFKEMETRIHSMALVHEKLYQAQKLSKIDLKEYIEDLTALLMQSYKIQPNRISLTLEADSVPVLIDTAVPCGLILNELISNALKHAFPGRRKGEIRVGLRKRADETIELRVTDNGVGVPPNFDFSQSNSLGLQTVLALGERQLQGNVRFKAGKGVTCQITFQDILYSIRV